MDFNEMLRTWSKGSSGDGCEKHLGGKLSQTWKPSMDIPGRFKPEHWRRWWCYEESIKVRVTSCHCRVIMPCLFTQINGPKITFLSLWTCCLQGLHEVSTFFLYKSSPVGKTARTTVDVKPQRTQMGLITTLCAWPEKSLQVMWL